VPITSTSANLSDEEGLHDVNEIKTNADYMLDGGTCSGEPFTRSDLVDMKIMRKGTKYREDMA